MRRITYYEAFLTVMLALASLIFSLSPVYIVKGNSYSINLSQSSSKIDQPSLILQEGTDNVSIVYMNETSAKITINFNASQSGFNYTLNISNNSPNSSEIKLEYIDGSGLNCTNATIILHDNNFSLSQIIISGGNITQETPYYYLASNATIYIGVQNLICNINGTTILHTNLKIKTPNKTIYALYEITFEFTYDT